MSSHLYPVEHQHGAFGRAMVVLAVILVLIMLCATRAIAHVGRAESGDNVKPMSAARYAVIKAQIRGERRYHVIQTPRLIRWIPRAGSGWQSPWPK